MFPLNRFFSRSTAFSGVQAKRLIHTLSVNGYDEQIFTRKDYPLPLCRQILETEKIAVLGYGPQGRGQSLNLKDNGFDVIVGVRKNGTSWDKALSDGWTANHNLFEIDEATSNATVIAYLLSDAGQISEWSKVASNLHENNTLYFSHGFGIVFHEQTGIIPAENIDVVLCAPKGPGMYVREEFLQGSGINASFAVHQNFSGKAFERVLALTFGIGTLNAFQTSFKNEVHSDLVGERCVLMGLIAGAFRAQYNVLRKRGHSPSEAFNETVEEALVSLYPMVNENGMDWMFRNCSTTAQRGALDWCSKFEEVLTPVIEDCYEKVVTGVEARNVIAANKTNDYRSKLEKELKEMEDDEIWKVGKILRQMRNSSTDDFEESDEKETIKIEYHFIP